MRQSLLAMKRMNLSTASRIRCELYPYSFYLTYRRYEHALGIVSRYSSTATNNADRSIHKILQLDACRAEASSDIRECDIYL